VSFQTPARMALSPGPRCWWRLPSAHVSSRTMPSRMLPASLAGRAVAPRLHWSRGGAGRAVPLTDRVRCSNCVGGSEVQCPAGSHAYDVWNPSSTKTMWY